MESNDGPEIPDRGETSDIRGLPSGAQTMTRAGEALRLKESTLVQTTHTVTRAWGTFKFCESTLVQTTQTMTKAL